MFLRIIFVAAVVATAMVVVKDGRLLARAGLIGGCTQLSVDASDDATWQACNRGRLDKYPDLTNKSCVSFGVKRGREFWRCPTALVSSNVPRG
jgi:hypothetical protein